MTAIRFAVSLEGICGRCLGPLPEGRGVYCSKQCLKAAWRKRRKARGAPSEERPEVWCPHPLKAKFDSQKAAERRIQYRFPTSSDIVAYECICGRWHIGHVRRKAS